ncbi:MAG: hypothetical protein DRJ97_03115 [Thermoprotei archaeon]|nr:MAG: hypothetical protein DRJ97_03115 [Thermoprotei archaeon]
MRRGFMYIDKDEVKGRMTLEKILDLVFTSTVSYKEIALEILSWMKDKALEERRIDLWVSRSELSRFINERFGRNRRSTAYKVIREFLLPMGMLMLDADRDRYVISREFARALRRLADSYEVWLKSRP